MEPVQQRDFTVTPGPYHGTLSIAHQHGELMVTRGQAMQLLGELAAELLESAPAGEHRPIGRALGDLLEAMSEALTRRSEV